MNRLHAFVVGLALLASLAACAPSEAPPPAAHAPLPAPSRSAPPVRVVPAEWQSRLPVVAKDQAEATLGLADDALARGQLERGNSPGPGALELYLAVVAIDPDNERAQDGVRASLEALFELGRIAMRSGDLALADHVEAIARSVQPDHIDLPVYRKYLAEAHAQQLALRQIRERLKNAWIAAKAEDFKTADRLLVEADRIVPGSDETSVMGSRIGEWRQARSDDLLAQGNAAVARLQLARADRLLDHVARVAAQPARVQMLAERIHLARHYGPFKPGQTFAEPMAVGAKAPEMIVVPYGRFAMGADGSDPQSQPGEQPQHEVVFARGFAIARNEVTVGDFRRFIAATGYRSLATRLGTSTVYDVKGGVLSDHLGVDWRSDHFGRVAPPELPVVHIAFEDAQSYARWLSKQTGGHYRLPSEAEFEYVLRAGSARIYPWGDAKPRRILANLAGDGDLSPVGRHWDNAVPGYRDAFWGLAPVRTFPIEHFGTYDMLGNASEWTLDCWHESFQRAPDNGSAWINPGCPQQVVRGASWDSALDQARSAYRQAADASTHSARLGFRVVRDI